MPVLQLLQGGPSRDCPRTESDPRNLTHGCAALCLAVCYRTVLGVPGPACRTCPPNRHPFDTGSGKARSHKTPTLPPLRFWASPPILPLPQKHHPDPREAKVGQTALTFSGESSTTTKKDILCDPRSCPFNEYPHHDKKSGPERTYNGVTRIIASNLTGLLRGSLYSTAVRVWPKATLVLLAAPRLFLSGTLHLFYVYYHLR